MIELRELVVQYQPQVDVATGAVCGLESLVRWRRDGAMVPHEEFLAVAEDSGLMPAITAAVLDEVLLQQRRWQARGDARPVTVNLSAPDLRNPDLVEDIHARLIRHGVAPGLLQVELTEHVLMRDRHHANTALQGLRGLGVRVTLDDFGTGLSSLPYVQRLGLDALKIDRRFVTDMCEVRGDAVVVGVAIDVARAFGLEVIAEGVESLEVATALANRGCDVVQGDWISPPLSAAQLEVWLGRHAPRRWAA
jgi:EAL domain-containing protein (putative c-di-GMP-specific phosphodiesterase class I)